MTMASFLGWFEITRRPSLAAAYAGVSWRDVCGWYRTDRGFAESYTAIDRLPPFTIAELVAFAEDIEHGRHEWAATA